MQTFRITVQVTLDVTAEESGLAVMKAVDKVKKAIGDDGIAVTGSPDRPMWVTGIAQDSRGFMIFGRPSQTVTVAESTAPEETEEYL